MEIVGFRVGHTWIEFGSDETLHSWFATIAERLEDGKWGSKFPLIMNNLYFLKDSGIAYEETKKFYQELLSIKHELIHLKPQDAIWGQHTKSKAIPKNAMNLNRDAVNLLDFYISNHNKSLFYILEKIATDLMPHEKASCFLETRDHFFIGVK